MLKRVRTGTKVLKLPERIGEPTAFFAIEGATFGYHPVLPVERVPCKLYDWQWRSDK